MDDDYIRTQETALHILNEGKLPGAYWVDFLPILKYVPAWVPGAKAKQMGVRYRSLVQRARSMGFEFTQSSEVRTDTFVSMLLLTAAGP